MSYQGKIVKIPDFTGGYCGGLSPQTLGMSQAADLDNIVLISGGTGFRNRGASVQTNSSEFGSADTYPVVGIGSWLQSTTGSNGILVVKNGKAYEGSGGATRNSDTFTDRTGAVTIAASVSASTELSKRRWSFCQHNDLLIAFGGTTTTPDTPFRWSGAGNNIVALAGSPPSALFCLSANNRVFAARTGASPNIIYWSVLGNALDWTGTGSGSAIAGSLNDSEPIMAIHAISNDLILIFKHNFIYAMDLTNGAPFPIRLLFSGFGCRNPGAACLANGIVYFMGIDMVMRSTNGATVTEYSRSASDIFYSTKQTISPTNFDITPFHFTNGTATTITGDSASVNWIVWNSFNNVNVPNLIWDIDNKCWLRCSTGFKTPVTCKTASGPILGGWYNKGRVFCFDTKVAADDSGESSGVINSYWQSGLLTGEVDRRITTNRMVFEGSSMTSGSATLTWGYNGGSLSRSASVTFTADADASSYILRNIELPGSGNYFQYKLAFSPTTDDKFYFVRGISLMADAAAPKVRTNA